MQNIFFKKENLKKILYFSLFISIAIFSPLLKNKIIVGTIVNATLIVSTCILGIRTTIFVGLLPSLIALSTGLVNPVLFALVPFIMISNALLIVVFGSLRKHDYLFALILASAVKCSFLFLIGFVASKGPINSFVISNIYSMISYHQIITVLLGDVVALILLKGFKIEKKI
ncbi:MAG: hypothetical protein JXA94_06260 [Parachlamydiales bacterium]|nr:hypothetical protein [Parachlamydiales bacterium]